MFTFILSSANAFNLDKVEFLSSGNGLNIIQGVLITLRKKPLENFVRKGEYAGNQHFLLNTQCVLPFCKQFSMFKSYLYLVYKCSQFGVKFLLFGEELKVQMTWFISEK